MLNSSIAYIFLIRLYYFLEARAEISEKNVGFEGKKISFKIS